MTETTSPRSASLTALALKLVGGIVLAASLLDFLLLLLPSDFQNVDWMLQISAQAVDRGSVPLIGIALMMLGIWADAVEGRDSRSLRSVPLVLSGVFAILFLLMAPLHFNASRQASAQTTTNINNQLTQAEGQLNARLDQEKAQIQGILASPDQLSQIKQQLASGKLPKEQQAQLQQVADNLGKFKDNPKALEEQQQAARTKLLGQMRGQQKVELDKRSGEFRRSSMRVIGNSLIMAIGYGAILVTGLTGKGR
jgi:DNA polymerase III gamma/tau subunit